MDNETEFVTYQQWDLCARRVFKKNIRETGKSLSESGIARRAHSYIVCIHPGKDDNHGELEVKKGWRKAMQTEAAND